MILPKPAGYYLPLPEALEIEITSLNFDELVQTLADFTCYLNRDDEDSEFDCAYTSNYFSAFIDFAKESDLISLIRWIAERLSWLESQEKANAQP